MLPSQSTRSRDSRRHTYRRRRSKLPRLALILLLVVGAVIVAWRLALGGDDEPAAPPVASALDAGRAVTESQARKPAVQAPPPSERSSQRRPAAPAVDERAATAGRTGTDEPAAMPEIRMAEPVPALPDTAAATPPATRERATESAGTAGADPARDTAAPPVRPSAQSPLSRDVAGILDETAHLPLPEQRRRLNAALARAVDDAAAAALRARLSEINRRLLFSPEDIPDDPFTFTYTISSGDSLARIVDRLGLQVDWRFLKRINGIPNENLIRAGQRIKVVTGPFHAVIDKSDYRLDLYLGEGRDQVYVRSFPVGTGLHNGTPTGLFRIRADSKLVDPVWINPRTRERYAADDPANPIGERWIGLEGVDESNRDISGYGIHGTIEPETIGTQASMGCVRMLDEDVAVVYEMLMEGVSGVMIRE